MIRQVALAILLICLALPVMAAPLCHVAVIEPTSAAMSRHHVDMLQQMGAPTADHRHQPSKQQHMCIGCIAPAKDMAMVPLSPPLVAPIIPPIFHELGDLHASPQLRPPQA